MVTNDTVIGETALELGDAPMGVAFGRFFPNDSSIPFAMQAPPTRVEFGGKVLHWDHGISILTPSGASLTAEAISLSYCRDDPVEIEIQVLGIPSEDYEALFPEHLIAYHNLFKPDAD